MSETSPLREPPALHAFRQLLSGPIPDLRLLDSLLNQLEEEASLDHALMYCKQQHRSNEKDDPWRILRTRLEKAAVLARGKRISQWQTDARRCMLRLRMEIRQPACQLHPPALQTAIARSLLEAGLPLAMGLEKSPRPMVSLGHPLPAGVEGQSEWADAVLREAPRVSLDQLPGLLAPHCPEGIRILEARDIPNISSPVMDLCCEAHWRWTCPPEWLEQSRLRLSDFERAATFTIEKSGKVEGRKQIKHVEVRHLLRTMAWEGNDFCFSTRIATGEATNPVKILAAILSTEPAAITALIRERVVLCEDPRLAESSRYETKLHNIYEDAVLLDGGIGVALVDEEDDEPLVLQRNRKVQRN
jgi:radical SAM-linked protein